MLLLLMYFAVVLGIGVYLKRYANTANDFFMAGREMSAWVAGLSFLSANLGALELMGWAAAAGRLDAPAFLIYLAAILWTMGYDTIYALQDSRDDAIAGVRSTARLFGAKVREGVGLLYLGAVISALAAIVLSGGGLVAHLGLTAFAFHLVWQTRQLHEGLEPSRALHLFRANRDAGLLLFAGLALAGMF